MEEVIQCHNLSKRYLNISARVQITAISDFNMSLKRSELTALIGRNGSGKSTILRIFATLIRPSSGTVVFHSETYGHLDIRRDAQKVRREIGFLPENPLYYPNVSAFATLVYFGRLRGQRNAVDRAHELLRRFRLKKWADIPVGIFSHGMRQRLGLASTLVHDPSVLLLDEPFQGLDFQSIKEITDLLREEQSRHNRTILYSTHDPRLVQEADNSIHIEEG